MAQIIMTNRVCDWKGCIIPVQYVVLDGDRYCGLYCNYHARVVMEDLSTSVRYDPGEVDCLCTERDEDVEVRGETPVSNV